MYKVKPRIVLETLYGVLSSLCHCFIVLEGIVLQAFVLAISPTKPFFDEARNSTKPEINSVKGVTSNLLATSHRHPRRPQRHHLLRK